MTSNTQSPKQDWLNIVTTSKARTKIRQALKEMEARQTEFAKETIERKFKNRKVDYDESVMMRLIKKMGYKTVWAVFQPFTYSRTSILFDDFVRVLQIPDKCVMTEIMGSREVNTYGIYTKDLADKIPGSVWFNTFEEVVDYVIEHAQSGDIIITLGCGDIYKAAKMMVNKLTK